MAKAKSTSAPAIRMSAMDKQYRAQDDLRTIQRAAEIQSDKGRMTAAQKEAQNQMAALSSVAKKK